MLPAKALATAAGAPDPARVAWQAGLGMSDVGAVAQALDAPVVADRPTASAPD